MIGDNHRDLARSHELQGLFRVLGGKDGDPVMLENRLDDIENEVFVVDKSISSAIIVFLSSQLQKILSKIPFPPMTEAMFLYHSLHRRTRNLFEAIPCGALP